MSYELFQYQGYTEPFFSAFSGEETITMDKWYHPPALVFWPIPDNYDGWFTGPVFDLADQPVSMDQWFHEAVDVVREIPPTSLGWFSLNLEPIPNPPAPDFVAAVYQDFIWTVPLTPQGWFSLPTLPIPNIGDSFFVPKLGYRFDHTIARMSINMMADIFNSLIRSGRLRFFGVGNWDTALYDDDVIEALGYTPAIDTTVPPPSPPPVITGDIVNIISDSVNPIELLAQVYTVNPHGLSLYDNVLISGNSNSTYNVATVVDSMDGPNHFQIQVLWDADGTGGTFTKL